MSLAAGTRLGPYEILEPIGKGGMGEVYRARDTKLDRDVAIKVLPEEFAKDKERLARFEREAKLLASLNHPNIASIYGLEEEGGVKALVLELVEGPTLAERIAEGPILVEEVLSIARQVAEAADDPYDGGRSLRPMGTRCTDRFVAMRVSRSGVNELSTQRTIPNFEVSAAPRIARCSVRRRHLGDLRRWDLVREKG